MKAYNINKLNSSFKIDSAINFSTMLKKSNYKFIFNSFLRNMVGNDIWIDEKVLNDESVLDRWNKKDIVLFKFLFKGDKIENKIIEEILGKESQEFLISINFAKLKDDFLYSNGYSIVPINDMFILVSTPNEYNNEASKFVDIYIGQDSFSMMNMISDKKFKNILDLCAGSGIQGFNALKSNNCLLTSIEINENAYNSIKINAALNGMDENTSAILSDLYDKIKDTKFDCILSNPPYVPAPTNINVPICGDGGEDGFKIVKKIISGYEKYLTDDGYAYMVLECIGNDEEPYIIDVFKQYVKNGILNIRVITAIPVEMQIDYSVDLISYLSNSENNFKVRNEFERIFRENKAIKMYSVVIEYINKDVPLIINRIDTNNIPIRKQYSFNEDIEFDKIKLEFIKIMIDKKPILNINKNIFKNIKKNNTVKELFDSLKSEERDEYMLIFTILKENKILDFEKE
ncbi:methyltransferase [Peptococcus niger]|uniref:Methyltransferase small domain-containing protein n=1 Tax=Peptococcus niger TaxID=2741 RepID=A0A1G7AB47_PEPNI|nr:methyltransferase [Peptococcus niger]SDE11096.1 Methyltransferase small domain-containing protein [Peptococcus niger]